VLPDEPDGPTHAYIGASSACWRRWSDVLISAGGAGRTANDAYAAQHPGEDGRRQRQSVAVHLIALCHNLEHGITDPVLTQLTRQALDGRPDWPWLDPPGRYELTVHDLAQPMTVEEIRTWASSVWQAWDAHHRTVRAWAEELLERR
jgi:hypothetical protein